MNISVVLATRDRASQLEATLDALSAQECPGCEVEIVVVDNASVDATPQTVAAAARRSPFRIVYLREDRPGKSHALNTAIARAAGELLVFTDDDVLPERSWLNAYVRAFEETGADYAAGRILPLWEAEPPRWMSPALHGVLAIPDGGTRRLRLGAGTNVQIMPIGANMAVRRHVLAQIGGWNPSLGKLQGTLRTGEDHEFALRMTRAGFRGVYEPGACVRHRVPADRLHKAYFQRWFYDNGVIVAGLEDSYPSTNRYLFNTPRYLWRQALNNVWAGVKAGVMHDEKRLTASSMRLRWFAGYVRARWSSRRPHAVAPRHPADALPRS